MLLIGIAGVGPVLAVALLIGHSVRPDLSDLSATGSAPDGRMIVAWPALLRDPSRALDADSGIVSGAPACALGYLSDGTAAAHADISRFVLLPEAGSFLHTAHRFGDQMIAIQLRAPEPVRFAPDSLVWACGKFQMISGDPAGSVPLYALADADLSSGRRRRHREVLRTSLNPRGAVTTSEAGGRCAPVSCWPRTADRYSA